MVVRTEVIQLFEWLEGSGDRISQLGGIELGFAQLDAFPELEPFLLRLTRTFLNDDPDDNDGRLSLLSSLVVLVDGEFARVGILRNRRPYWRRLAAIAQESIIERQAMGARTPVKVFREWATEGRAELFYLQTSQTYV